MNPLRVDLEPRLDSEDNIYHIGTINFPGTIDLRRTTFLVFLSVEGEEELQITTDDKEYSSTSFVQKRRQGIKIKLGTRTDQNDQKYFIGKVRLNASVKANRVTFMVFTSKEGMEELQITGELVEEEDARPLPRRMHRTPVDEVEVVRSR